MAELSTPHQLGDTSTIAAAVLTDSNRALVAVIAVVALAALVLAGVLVRQVLAAGEGTDSMKKIAAAVQEGANAYLARQLRTLGVFAVVVFFLLMLLPADDWNQRAGRSIFFLIGAAFSAATGYIGMWLAVRSNVRVARGGAEATPAPGEPERISLSSRTKLRRSHFARAAWSACSRWGSACWAPAAWCWCTRPTRRRCWRASASVPR